MQNPIKNLKIKNFKSIKGLEMDCSRINILVGKPNVGKSNILEALGLFCAPYSAKTTKVWSDIIRYNDLKNLFYDNDISGSIDIISNIGNAKIKINKYGQVELFLSQDIDELISITKEIDNIFKTQESLHGQNKDSSLIPEYYTKLSIKGGVTQNPIFNALFNSPVRKYSFSEYKDSAISSYTNVHYLLPPGGSNLFEVLQLFPELRKQVASYFDEYGLKLLLDFENKSMEVQKEVDGIAYKTPFNLIADTLQRIIFHYAAIESNKDSVILFEEPENHSFPPYIRELAEKIVEDTDNQYFITTHSPYLLNTIIENADDVAVFVTTFENYETKVKRLTKNDLSELLDHGVDIFFNLKWFENE